MIDAPYILSILKIHVSRISSKLNNSFFVPIRNVQSLDSPIDNVCNKFNITLLESGLNIHIFVDTIAQFINSTTDYINVKYYK